MIRSLVAIVALGLLGGVGPAHAFEPDRTIEGHRSAFEALTEEMIGRASRRVRFDWRKAGPQLAVLGGLPAEFNNFDTLRAGALLRVPLDDLLFELGLSYAWVSGSEGSRDLARTPYRQPGRPDRIELDLGVAYPIAEGVVTPAPNFVPAVELVLNVHAQFRYFIYPGAYEGLDWKQILRSTVAGTLSDEELDNLEDDRLPGMELDPARYQLYAGIGNDLYFQSGLFFSHRYLVAVPLLDGINDTKLGFGFELDIALGYAF